MALLGWLWGHPRLAMLLLMLVFSTIFSRHPRNSGGAGAGSASDPGIGTAQGTINYPAGSLGDGHIHTAVLLAYLDPSSGRVNAAKVERSSGDPALDQLAVDTMQQHWELLPNGLLHRSRVRVEVTLDPR